MGRKRERVRVNERVRAQPAQHGAGACLTPSLPSTLNISLYGLQIICFSQALETSGKTEA